MRDLCHHLLSQDLVYVGGGSVISMLGVWRAHGLDDALREAWERGVVMCGLSAGSLCWFAEGITAFHGESRPVRGLGLLPCSNAVHYDKEPARRPAYREAIAAGMAAGYAPTTAPPCTSSAPSWPEWSPRARRRRPIAWSVPARRSSS